VPAELKKKRGRLWLAGGGEGSVSAIRKYFEQKGHTAETR
jgi:hypothetical protein